MNQRYIAVAFATIIRKEVRRFTRIWVQTLIPPAITMSLYFLIFGSLIGSRIGQMGSVDYMRFVVPGLIMMSVINSAFANVASSFFSAKFNKSIEELLVSPTPNIVILLGYVGGGALRGLCVGAIVTVLSLFFSDFSIHSVSITACVVVLSAMLFAVAGLINGIFANSFDDISVIPTFVLTPLTYLGGVFYSVDLLPDFWRALSYANPILYLVNAFRYGMLGISDVNVYAALLGILGFLIAAFLYCLWLMEKSRKLRN